MHLNLLYIHSFIHHFPHHLSTSQSCSLCLFSSLITSRFRPRSFSEMEGDSTTVNITETPKERKGKAPLLAPPPKSSGVKPTLVQKALKGPKGGYKRGLAVIDVVLRIAGIAAALGAAIAMGSTDQTLPFFTQFFQFKAEFDDLPAFTFFVIANSITAAYLALSIPIAIVCIVRPHLVAPRVLLMFLDIVAVALTTAAAGGAASIVYLAHNGNSDANWPAICQQFNDFCQEVSGAVVASFIAVVVLMCLVVLSAFSI